MAKKKYLTKSRFKIASHCPTKLYYGSKKEYGNKMADDPFLKALAKGGYQVGELAKCYYPGGVDIKTLNKDLALAATNAELSKDKCVIYEPAIQTEKFFIRVDILKKAGNSLHLIEVKAKSIDPYVENIFYDKNLIKRGFHKFTKEWKDYLYDIAFQKAVAQIAFPNYNITCSLLLADKTSVATVDGLNQKFLIKKEGANGFQIETSAEITSDSLGDKILFEKSVDHEVNLILSGEDHGKNNRSELGIRSFHDDMNAWAQIYSNDLKEKPNLSSECKSCEFRLGDNYLAEGKKSGFNECWGVKQTEHTIAEVWDFRNTNKILESGRKMISELDEEDIDPQPDSRPGMSRRERQWIQIEKVQKNETHAYTDINGLCEEMADWKYPYNFIDFETSMVALPFNKGRRPYEQIAFQFSHHILNKDGSVEHANQFISETTGEFPNFNFVRSLKLALQNNDGSIFRYSNHENTVLLQIYEQLMKSDEADKDELCEWIISVTRKKDKKNVIWEGPRCMIDLWDVVKRFYYHPKTKGSNSIKYVLPAVLKESSALKQKYLNPIYGSTGGIKSLNFKDWAWLKLQDNGEPIDPYNQLGPLIEGHDNGQLEEMFFGGDEIKDGGAAATAFAMMQFSQMSDIERKRIVRGLLRYCELDTMAMVMITEHWLELIELAQIKAS